MPCLRRCYGWTTVSPTDITHAITRGLPRRLHASDVLRTISPGTGDYNAIVYEYIPDHKIDQLATQDGMDFFGGLASSSLFQHASRTGEMGSYWTYRPSGALGIPGTWGGA